MNKIVLAASLSAGLLSMGPSAASAAVITFDVIVNTAPLVGLAATQGPFSLDFQLNGIGANTVTIDRFDFGGGAFVGAPTAFGGAAGSLSSAVTLSDAANFSSELFQRFTPGARLRFGVTMTTNVVAPTPDAFSFAILDGSLFNIPTTGLGDSLLFVDITGSPVRFSQAQGTGAFAGVAATVVPEPASILLVGSGLVGVAARWRRRRAGQRPHAA